MLRKRGTSTRKSSRAAAFGIVCALAIHVAFFCLIVFRFAEKAPVLPVAVSDAPIVSIYRVRAAAPSSAFRLADSRTTPALGHVQAALPDPLEPFLPKPIPTKTALAPRLDDRMGPVLPPMQTPSPAPDLLSEPIPLHGESRSAPPGGAPPAPSTEPDCQIAQAIQQKFQQSQELLGALTHLPRQSRSVANAIMVWDGRWVASPQADDRLSVALVQTELIEIIRASPQECHARPVRGPQFISIADTTGATILVFGSGVWTWADLLR